MKSMKKQPDEQEMKNLADNIRLAMRERNWTQIDLAHASGVGQPRISGILNQKNEPSFCTVSRLAKALRRSMDDLASPPPRKKLRNAS